VKERAREGKTQASIFFPGLPLATAGHFGPVGVCAAAIAAAPARIIGTF